MSSATNGIGPRRSPDRRFQKSDRLRRRLEFNAVFNHRQSSGGEFVIVYGQPNGLGYNRLGLSVGRRFGGAAQRNRFKRICREAFRLTKDKQPMGWDWIILPAKPIAAGALGGSQWTLDSVRADMLRQMGRVAGRKSARTPRRASEPPRAHERDDRDRR